MPRRRLPPSVSLSIQPVSRAVLALGRPQGLLSGAQLGVDRRRRRVLCAMDLNCHVDTVASLTLEQAERVIVGTSFGRRAPRGRRRPAKARLHRLRQADRMQLWVHLPIRPGKGRRRIRLGRHLEELRSGGYPLVCILDYPLSVRAQVTIRPLRRRRQPRVLSVGHVLWGLARAYRELYRTPQRSGIWGHGIRDLWFEGLTVYSDGTAAVSIGS